MLLKFLCSICLLLFLTFPLTYFGQTANDAVVPYTEIFRYGSNTAGNVGVWNDITMANIAAGNASLGLPGAGVKSFRTALPHTFLETWGYTIRIPQFQHYASLGMGEHTVFIQEPSPAALNATVYCVSQPNDLFANLYEPIWDANNGTPYNENNFFAAYVWQVVNTYKDYVRFWEIWNEPDFSASSNAWAAPGVPGNWWDNDPDPCDLENMGAPIQHYIRMLRIAYEIVHDLDPDGYVATGGLGFPSFLDAILRNTDNPGAADGGQGAPGSVTVDYPLAGGAYFDVMSTHSYPQFSGLVGSTNRHSDAAALGDVDKKQDFETVLFTYGYDGTTYPEKVHIMTETNIGRQAFGGYIGGNEVQRNYAIKTSVMLQKNGLSQLYFFSMDDRTSESAATNTFDLMGLFQDLAAAPTLYSQVPNDIAWANATASTLLLGTTYDEAQTIAMNMPAGVQGAAFRTSAGSFVYVVWAETSIDQSEVAAAAYSFPAALGFTQLSRHEWDYSLTLSTQTVSSTNISLTAAPIFMIPDQPLDLNQAFIEALVLSSGQVELKWELDNPSIAFDVLRSQDGEQFDIVHQEAGKTSDFTYAWIDALPFSGRNYYQLIEHTLDGQISKSGIIEVMVPLERGVKLFPNPVAIDAVLHLQLNWEDQSILEWKWMDMQGRVVQSGRTQGKRDLLIQPPSVGGIYLLQIQQGRRQVTRKVSVF